VRSSGLEDVVRRWNGFSWASGFDGSASSWAGRLVESEARRLDSRIDGVGGSCANDWVAVDCIGMF
jgi:hypothetical protein